MSPSHDILHLTLGGFLWASSDRLLARRRLGCDRKSAGIITSTLHASLCGTHALYMLLTTTWERKGTNHADNYHHPQFMMHFMWEMSYYLWDTFFSHPWSHHWKSMLQLGFLVHHLLPLVGGALYYAWLPLQPPSAQFATSFLSTCVALINFSTPLMNLQWYLDKVKVSPTSAVYRLTYMAYLLVFAFLRFFGLVPLFRSVVSLRGLHPSTTLLEVVRDHLPLKCSVGTLILTALNLVWFVLTLRKMRKVFPRRR